MSPDRLSRNGGDLIRMIDEFERCAVPIVFVEEGFEVPLPHGVAAIRGQAKQNDHHDSKAGHPQG
jgi:DNA invertase Pin-like site-specific DNA recombinase